MAPWAGRIFGGWGRWTAHQLGGNMGWEPGRGSQARTHRVGEGHREGKPDRGPVGPSAAGILMPRRNDVPARSHPTLPRGVQMGGREASRGREVATWLSALREWTSSQLRRGLAPPPFPEAEAGHAAQVGSSTAQGPPGK